MCGGTASARLAHLAAAGLSPRVRGNHLEYAYAGGKHGSIPACAGEPPGDGRRCRSGMVYPRVCGGTQLSCRKFRVVTVYPRVCGGTSCLALSPSFKHGLSPRVRGNPVPAGKAQSGAGSIPACAGEPAGTRRRNRAPTVYPRVCGGTCCSGRRAQSPRGLSPRVRGNPGDDAVRLAVQRSIPACAGEPVCYGLRTVRPEVYPRVCGGTQHVHPVAVAVRGLSPRVRGNPAPPPATRRCPGSIPACAGEPGRRCTAAPAGQVYPRVCGGTRAAFRSATSSHGLSPRVRGNPDGVVQANQRVGSIPACAGEPRPCP